MEINSSFPSLISTYFLTNKFFLRILIIIKKSNDFRRRGHKKIMEKLFKKGIVIQGRIYRGRFSLSFVNLFLNSSKINFLGGDERIKLARGKGKQEFVILFYE